jgi:hypothetical protein
MRGRLLVSAGDVVEVQLAAEPPVDNAKAAKRKKGKPAPRRQTVTRMRVFLREADGKDQKFDFDDAQLGVRAGQRVAVARGVLDGVREPINLMLCNLSTGEQEIFERAVAVFLFSKPGFGPLLQGLVMAGAVWLITVALTHFVMTPGMSYIASFWYGAFVAFVLFWALWGAAHFWSRVTARGRFRRARAAFIADVETRVKAYAPSLR